MDLFLRYSSSIKKDLQDGNSYHYSDFSSDMTAEEVAEALNCDIENVEFNEEAQQWCQVIPGLCAFRINESDIEHVADASIEDLTDEEIIVAAKEFAKEFNFNGVYNSKDMSNWHILEGAELDIWNPEGCIIRVKKVLFSNE